MTTPPDNPHADPLVTHRDEDNNTTDIGEMHGPIMREKSEPREGFEPIPLLLVFFALGLVGWGGWYIGAYNANFARDVYDTNDLRTAGVATTDAKPKQIDPMVLGKRVYNSCMSCHQQDGQGLPGAYPPLVNSEWVLGEPEIFARIVLHGLRGSIDVRGETYNDLMPAWGNLSDERIAAVLTYVRNSWGNEAANVPTELVAQVRSATADRRTEWTAEELEQVRAELEQAPTTTQSTEDETS